MTERIVRSQEMRARHPGLLLKLQVLDASELSMTTLAKALGLATSIVSRVTQGKSAITADFAQRLELCLGGSAEFWLDLQSKYDLRNARQNQPTVEPIHIANDNYEAARAMV